MRINTLTSCILLLSTGASAFVANRPSTTSPLLHVSPSTKISAFHNDNNNENDLSNNLMDMAPNTNEDSNFNINDDSNNAAIVAASTVSLMTWLSTSGVASAAGPDWGVFEGRTGSLLHPIMMGAMLTMSVSTALLGFNWRRQRTMGDEIKSLKNSLPKLSGEVSTIQEGIALAKENNDIAEVAKLTSALSVEEQINELTAERKEYASNNVRDRHFNQGSLLAFVGTAFAIEGPLNTYARAGKLFPGPHLYAGAGLVVCWALAAACVPYMQKGNDTARTIHIGANIGGLGLFVWQVVSGIPILLKVVELTKWP